MTYPGYQPTTQLNTVLQAFVRSGDDALGPAILRFLSVLQAFLEDSATPLGIVEMDDTRAASAAIVRARLRVGDLFKRREKWRNGQETVALTSGEAKNPGPGEDVIEAYLASRIAELAAGRAGQIGADAAAGAPPSRRGRYAAAAGGVAGAAGIAHQISSAYQTAKGVHDAAKAAHSALTRTPAKPWEKHLGPHARKPSTRSAHGQEIVARTSGEASMPGPRGRTAAVRAPARKKILRATTKRLRKAATKSIVTRPLARGMHNHVGAPKIEMRGNAKIVSRTQTLINIPSPATAAFTNVFSIDINPGATLGDWAAGEARGWDEYEAHYVRFEFKPSGSGTDRGIVGMALDYDMNDALPASFQDASAYAGAESASVWLPVNVDLDLRNVVGALRNGQQANKRLRADGNFAGERTTYDLARLIMYVEGYSNSGAGNVVMGQLIVHYSFAFKAPHVQRSNDLSTNTLRAALRLANDLNLTHFTTTPIPWTFTVNNISNFTMPAGTGVATLPRGTWRLRGQIMFESSLNVAAGTTTLEIFINGVGVGQYNGDATIETIDVDSMASPLHPAFNIMSVKFDTPIRNLTDTGGTVAFSVRANNSNLNIARVLAGTASSRRSWLEVEPIYQ